MVKLNNGPSCQLITTVFSDLRIRWRPFFGHISGKKIRLMSSYVRCLLFDPTWSHCFFRFVPLVKKQRFAWGRYQEAGSRGTPAKNLSLKGNSADLVVRKLQIAKRNSLLLEQLHFFLVPESVTYTEAKFASFLDEHLLTIEISIGVIVTFVTSWILDLLTIFTLPSKESLRFQSSTILCELSRTCTPGREQLLRRGLRGVEAQIETRRASTGDFEHIRHEVLLQLLIRQIDAKLLQAVHF